MGFTDAVRTCLSKYVTISGRASRSEFWWFVLFVVLGQIVFSLIDSALGLTGSSSTQVIENAVVAGRQSPLAALFSLAMLLPLITAAGRRLHDRDMSAWWLLISLIPLIGSLILLVFYVMAGTPGHNRFGPPPV